MQSKTRLLFVIPSILKAGGVEKVVAQLSSYLQQTNHYQITILNCLPLISEPFYKIDQSIAIKSLNLPDYPSNPIAKILWYYQLVKPLDAFLSIHKYEIVFAEGGYLAASLSLCKAKNTIKVGCEHVNFASVNYFHRWLRIILFKRLAAVIVLTVNDKQYYQKFLKMVFHIPNFISSIPAEFSSHLGQTIVACGRLERQKGFDLLIDAFEKVHAQFPNWNLIIYGEGSKRQSLEFQRQKARLEHVVALPGEVPEISYQLKDASIFVLSSRFEGFPLILLEAMSLGLCCISFDIKGVNELLINNQNGCLVKALQVKKLTEKICSLIESHEQRFFLGNKAKETVKNYQLDSIGKQWERLIEQLAPKN